MNKKITPLKKYGQNFLINRGVQERIIRSCGLKADDFVFEIGPGKGALTKDIVDLVDHLWVIERDSRCITHLQENLKNQNLKIIEGDVLKFDWKDLPQNIKIIGNLPYNISTPIFEKIIQHRSHISECYLMTQLEFAKRLLAKPHTKNYGSLSCYAQFYMEGKILFKVNNTSFYPPPKVTSAFLCFKTLREPRYKSKNAEFLFAMIREGFLHRRKMLIKNLSAYKDSRDGLEDVFLSVGINPKARAEDCSLEQFVQLANSLG